MLRLTIPALLASLAMTAIVHGEVKTQSLVYEQGGVTLEGSLAWDPAMSVKRPGVVVVHEWWGLNDYAKRRAREVAALGYVVLAADVYGQGVLATTTEEAGKLAGKYRGDRGLLRARVQAAIDALKRQPAVDPKRIAVMGYCFGGTAALEAARSGADIAGVVSIHGGLDSLHPQEAKSIKARVLVLHGADDPTMKPADIAAFQDEMRQAHVDWQMIEYGNAVHAFSNPDAGKIGSPAVGYNKRADERSWEHLRLFLSDLFSGK